MPKTSTILMIVGACVVAFLIAFLGQRALTKQEIVFATVDLSAAVTSAQEQSIKMLMDANTKDVDRAVALERTKQFGAKVSAATAQLATECGCVLLVKEAVVAGSLPDLTPQLLEKLKGQ